MRKTENKRKKVQMPAGIRQKMMAAVSMLLVSSIMMVSSTYAWFTLSTAPEVTGITTSIGANGNLEMMLLTGYLEGEKQAGSFYSSEDDLGVLSEVGDSVAATQDVTKSNVKWGNLVDLSNNYGLENIVLSPARLNVTENTAGNTIGTTILKAPSYGSDGRVKAVDTMTYTGKTDGSTGFNYDTDHAGVRVIGTTTDVSARLGTYREAKAGITVSIGNAKNIATSSLNANGQELANILVAYATDENTTYNNGQLKSLKEVLTSLETASGHTLTAMKYAVIAYSLSSAQAEDVTFTDEEVAALKEAVMAKTTPEFGDISKVLIPSGLEDAISQYKTLNTKISQSLESLNTIAPGLDSENAEDGSYTFNQISGVLNGIVDKKYVQIAGRTDLGKDDLDAVISEFTSNGKISMVMMDGSGVYADLAKLTGDYTVSGLKVHVEYDIVNADVAIEMSTNCKHKIDKEGNDTGSNKVGNTEIPVLSNIAIGTAPQDKGQAANSKLSNTYGYALDFGFRTNAAASNLLLQTTAVNRVYTDQTTEEGAEALNTQGSGSYMQFESSNLATFSAEEVLALMSAIRVAFVSPTSTGGDLLAIGALDIQRTVDETTGLTTYTKGSTVTAIGGDTEGTTAKGYKAGLFLYDYTVTETADQGNTITLGNQLENKSAITALTQNKAMKVSVIVYLDGDIVDNTMVANANSSMSGHMNLQFSSSATLAPMENTGMRNGGSTGTPSETNYTKVASAGETYTYGGIYTGTVNEGYDIYQDASGNLYFKGTAEESAYTRLTIYNYTTVLTLKETVKPETTPTTPTPDEEDSVTDPTV